MNSPNPCLVQATSTKGRLFKVGDIITGYSPGLFRITAFEQPPSYSGFRCHTVYIFDGQMNPVKSGRKGKPFNLDYARHATRESVLAIVPSLQALIDRHHKAVEALGL